MVSVLLEYDALSLLHALLDREGRLLLLLDCLDALALLALVNVADLCADPVAVWADDPRLGHHHPRDHPVHSHVPTALALDARFRLRVLLPAGPAAQDG